MDKNEIRFRMAEGPLKVARAAAKLRGVPLTTFVQICVTRVLAEDGDYDRFVSKDTAAALFDHANKDDS